MAKILHYRNKCIGCNSCVELDPNHWEMNEGDGKSELRGARFNKGVGKADVLDILDIEKEDAKKAEESCPVNIIKVVE